MREHGAGQIPELAALLGDRVRDFGIGMAEVRDVGAADSIEVALAALVDQPAPVAFDDFGILVAQLAVEDVSVGVAVGVHTKKLSPIEPSRSPYGPFARLC